MSEEKNKVTANELIHMMSKLIRKDMFDGDEHWVVPTVLIKSGVWSGSKGPVLYTNEELSKFVEAWNGRPVPVYHPVSSANDPETLERMEVGRLFNVEFVDGKLKGEVWLNVRKLKDKALQVYNLLAENKHIDVSTSFFNDLDEEEGELDGKKYIGVVKNIRPDHLAILPHEKGACSWDDGAGMPRNNQRKDSLDDNIFNKFVERLISVLSKKTDSTDSTESLSKNETKENEKMDEILKALIDNESTRLTEDDRVWLEKLEENQLKTLIPIENKEEDPPDNEDEDEEEEAPSVENIDFSKFSVEEFIALANETVQNTLNDAVAFVDEHNAKLVEAITSNSEFEKDEMKGRSRSDLEKLAKALSSTVDNDFTGVNNGGSTDDDETPLEIPRITFDD